MNFVMIVEEVIAHMEHAKISVKKGDDYAKSNKYFLIIPVLTSFLSRVSNSIVFIGRKIPDLGIFRVYHP